MNIIYIYIYYIMIYGKCIVSLGKDLCASEDSPKSRTSTFDDRLAWWGSSGCCCWGMAAWQDVAGDPGDPMGYSMVHRVSMGILEEFYEYPHRKPMKIWNHPLLLGYYMIILEYEYLG